MPLKGTKSGDLRKWVSVLANQGITQDSVGALIDDLTAWKPIYAAWAKITPSDSILASNKTMVGQQVTAQATHLVTMRYDPRMDASKRIQYGTRNFEVCSVTDVEEINVTNILVVRELKS